MTLPSLPRAAIDPTLKAVTEAMPLTFTAEDGVEVARRRLRELSVRPPAGPALRTANIEISGGDLPAIPARVYWPPTEQHENLPVVVFYHGGGWSIGDLDTHDAIARAHAVGSDAIVVSVGYRLAPEHPFPSGIDDSWVALQWVGQHAAEFGGDASRIAVAGDSAGGNFAAVMAHKARDNGGPSLAFQLLWYPSTTCDIASQSMIENAHAPVLDSEVIRAFLTWYLPANSDLTEPAKLPVELAPANAATFSGLPPAFIGTAGHDPLHDDGARYAQLLRGGGVSAEWNHEPSLVHGYLGYAQAVPAAAQAAERGLAALRAALHG